jgi:cytolysin-activating lysine-acyltransferase
MTNTNPPTAAPGLPAAEEPVAGALPPQELAGLAELAKKQAHKVLGKIPLLGPVAWLMMQQSHSRHTLLSELEWRVLPALLLDQAKLYMKDDAPVAFASWARLSEAAAQRYRNSPHQLVAGDWASGDQVWLIDVFTPFGGAQDVLKDLRENVLSGQVIHQLVPAPDAVAKVLAWPAKPPDAAAGLAGLAH